MKEAFCYGVIPLKKEEDEWVVLLIKHVKGDYWSFPKGHAELGETPKESAERELAEETGLHVVRYLSEEMLTESYRFMSRGEQICKTVSYFLAEVDGNVMLQEEEIIDSRWVPLSSAEQELSFKEAKSLSRQAVQIASLH